MKLNKYRRYIFVPTHTSDPDILSTETIECTQMGVAQVWGSRNWHINMHDLFGFLTFICKIQTKVKKDFFKTPKQSTWPSRRGPPPPASEDKNPQTAGCYRDGIFGQLLPLLLRGPRPRGKDLSKIKSDKKHNLKHQFSSCFSTWVF
jgi:hypothetical protein